MQRKGILLGVLGTFVLGGCATATLAVDDPIVPEVDSQTSTIEAETHSISVSVDRRISVDVATSAAEGEAVEAALTYDADKVTVHDLLVNGHPAARIDATHFVFPMPAADAAITVDATIVKDHQLVNLAADDVDIIGLDPLGFDACDDVSFSLGLKPGSAYSLGAAVEIGILDEEGLDILTAVDWTIENDVYTFTAPADLEGEIGVKPLLSPKWFSIDSSASNINSTTYLVNSDDTTTSTNGYAIAGSTIRVGIFDSTSARATGIKIVETGETYLDEDDDNYVYFTMPARNVTIEAVVEYITYDVTIDTTKAPHLEVTLYSCDESGEEPVYTERPEPYKVIPNEDVYIEITSSDPTLYKLGSISGTYGDYGYSFGINAPTATVPYHNFWMRGGNSKLVLTEVLSSEISVTSSDAITLQTYVKNSDDTYTESTRFFPGDTVYVKETATGEIVHDALALIYDNGHGHDKVLDVTSTSGDYYYFTFPDTKEAELVVAEPGETKYAEASWVGEYVGFELWSWYSNNQTFGATATFSADGSYTTSQPSGSGKVFMDGIVDDYGNSRLFATGSLDESAYNGDLLLCGYSSNTGLNTNDVELYVKKGADDTVTAAKRCIYSSSDIQTGESRVYMAQIFKNGATMNVLCVINNGSSSDYGHEFYLDGVEFVDADDAAIANIGSSDSLNYQVKVNGVLRGTVTSGGWASATAATTDPAE